MVDSKVFLPKEEIAEFCRRNRIRRMSLFGSVLAESFKEDSDVGVLVEFEPGHVPGFLGLAGMEEELSGLLGGRKVDLRTPDDLGRYFRREVMAAAESIYG